MNIKNWTTNRLILQSTKEEDFDELCKFLLDYQVSKYIPKYPHQIRSIEDAKPFFYKNLFDNLTVYTIRIKDNNEAIGQYGYFKNDEMIAAFYWLGSEFQGKGYASEASIEISNQIFRKTPQQKFVISLHDENLKSRKLAQKIIDYMIKENPNWEFIDHDDGCETYEVISIDDQTVKLKQIESKETKIVNKSTFPDEFMAVGAKEIVDTRSLIITKH